MSCNNMQITVEELESTTFCGKRFTRKQIVSIQETVNMFPHLSRSELGHTVCEHLNWTTPKGVNKLHSCLNVLEQMEQQGILRLPAKQDSKKINIKEIVWTKNTDERPLIETDLNNVLPLRIKKATQKKEITLWNEYVDRYHYLHYRRPIGNSLRYFIVSEKTGEPLGCLLFSTSAIWSMACRDSWIGWTEKNRKKRLNWILTNNRFLIFPWVQIKHLASKSLAMVAQQIANDWQETFGYRPVLLETFVDPLQRKGTCYQSANWQYIGETSGKKWKDPQNRTDLSPKDVYVYPLTPQFRDILNQKLAPVKQKSLRKSSYTPVTDEKMDSFSKLWFKIMDVILKVAQEIDDKWLKRHRVINSMLIVLFIFRLVFSKNKQGYGITLQQLWQQCRQLNYPLLQKKPVVPSAICNARKKLPSTIFKELNTRIIQTYEDPNAYTWNGHRIFAVDGTKIFLPRSLIEEGYALPSQSYYPQGLVSCLYQLKSQIPYDFDLSATKDERSMAAIHLNFLKQNDVVVYDRGYFSYELLYRHVEKNIDAVFRLQINTYAVIKDFFKPQDIEKEIIIIPSKKRQKKISKAHPDIIFRPIKLRLLKYTIAQTTYVIGTTLLDKEKYPLEILSEVYHSRWGIEELYKISKVLIDVEDFHGQSERGVKQELFAHFGIITINRIFANYLEANMAQENQLGDAQTDMQPLLFQSVSLSSSALLAFKINFKNALITIARNLEALFVRHAVLLKKTVHTIMESLSACKQRIRPNRSYKRQSHKPIKKWRPSKTKTATVEA